MNNFFIGINIRKPEDFYEKLYNFDENKKKEMIKKAKEYYEQRCSNKVFKENYLEVINQFISIKKLVINYLRILLIVLVIYLSSLIFKFNPEGI